MTTVGDYVAAVAQPALGDGEPRFDELVAPDGTFRANWKPLAASIISLTQDDLVRVGHQIDQFLDNDGVTYNRSGPAESRRWRLDPIPLVIGAQEWAPLEVGLAQRTELLNAILVDLYGAQKLLSTGVLPPAVVFSHQGFVRSAARASAKDSRPLLIAAADLGRNAVGEWQVIADHAQAPSGIGYAMENRRIVSRVLPELYREAGLHRVAPFFQALRSTLVAAAPGDISNPRVVVLTPGTHSETAYDQAFVASSLGFPLVQGNDLTVRDGTVRMRVMGRLERVDVILRRVDAAWSDPLELRADSQLGVPGLAEAARRGTVRIVNGLGTGILENPGLLPFMSAMCEVLLDEPLRLRSVQTYWCGDPTSASHVLAHLDSLIIRTIDRAIVAEPGVLSTEARASLRAQILAEPHRFVGQEPLALSQAPTLDGHSIKPRGMVLRTFTVSYGSTYRPLVGGLASAVEDEGVSTSKDVWVLKERPEDPDQGLAEVLPMTNVRAPAAMVPRVLEDMFWVGRYSERAEDLLRLVLATHAVSEDFRSRPQSAGGTSLQVLMDTLASLSPTRQTDPVQELRDLLLDTHRPGTVAQSIAGLRDAAQGVRDQLSDDAWLVLGSVERAASTLNGVHYSRQIADSGNQMLSSMLALSGVTSNMMRDPGWYMLDIGRGIERSLQVIKLMRGTITIRRGIDVDRLVGNSLLAAAESSITHRRRYRGYIRATNLLELLLLDESNPRSVAFQLVRMRTALDAIPGTSGSTRPERLLDDLHDELELVDLAALVAIEGEARPNLERFLDAMHAQVTRLADAVAAHHFAPAPAIRTYGQPRVGQ
ncbi:circularly permuted type 2 ATP-grasp protein [soil metagenome]